MSEFRVTVLDDRPSFPLTQSPRQAFSLPGLDGRREFALAAVPRQEFSVATGARPEFPINVIVVINDALLLEDGSEIELEDGTILIRE